MTESKAQDAAREWVGSRDDMEVGLRAELTVAFLAGYAKGQRDLLEAARGVTALCQCTDFDINSFDDWVVKLSDLEALVKGE